MKTKLACLAVATIAVSAAFAAHAEEPKSGGILRMYQRENPPSMSIHEEATYSVNVSSMPIFSNLVIYDQHKAQNSIDTDPARTGDQLDLERRQEGTDLQAARGREMARRQAVHGCRREMHIRHAARQVAEQIPQEPAQGLVLQPRRRHDRRRHAGDLPPEPSAARDACDARVRLFADLSVPCVGRARAHQSDRHRAVQVRRAEAERVDQAREEPRLLQEGPALPRRHRIHDPAEPLDRDPRLRRRQVRHHLPDRGVDPADEGREVAEAGRGVRAGADQRRHQPDHESRRRTLQRRQCAPRVCACARPQSVSRHHVRRQVRHRRRDAAAARRRVGYAARTN